MRATVRKWGNSAAVRLPRDLLEQCHLEVDDEVVIEAEADRIVVRPVHRQPKYSLDELLDGITEQNRHGEVDWGESSGRETF